MNKSLFATDDFSDFEMLSYFEMSPDFVCIADREGFFKKVNPAVINTLQYSPEELYRHPISHFMHPEDRAVTSSERDRLLNGQALKNFQNRYLSKNGDVIWLDWTSVYLPDKELVFAIAKIITANKQKEQETIEKYQSYKNLAIHFKDKAEEDRKHIAVALHEDVAQIAAALKMNISWISNHLKEENALRAKVEDSLVLSDIMIKTLRELSYSYNPMMIDDVGLEEYMEWTCKEFSSLTGIPANLSFAIDEADLAPKTKLDYTRLLQEVLKICRLCNDVVKIMIAVEEHNNSIIFTGQWICAEKNPQPATGNEKFLNISQLALSMNGVLEQKSADGIHTLIVRSVH